MARKKARNKEGVCENCDGPLHPWEDNYCHRCFVALKENDERQAKVALAQESSAHEGGQATEAKAIAMVLEQHYPNLVAEWREWKSLNPPREMNLGGMAAEAKSVVEELPELHEDDNSLSLLSFVLIRQLSDSAWLEAVKLAVFGEQQ